MNSAFWFTRIWLKYVQLGLTKGKVNYNNYQLTQTESLLANSFVLFFYKNIVKCTEILSKIHRANLTSQIGTIIPKIQLNRY